MSSKKLRSSNFELLRIVAMFMIVIFHIVFHTVYEQLTNAKSIALMNNGLFNNPIFYKKLLTLVFILPLGKVGDTIFLLISGYFMINKEQIDLGKIAKKLLLPLMFATTSLVIISFTLHRIFPDVFISLIPITNVNIQSWFLGYYFLVMVMAALFLNRFLAKMDRKKYLAFLLVMFAIISFGWTGNLLNNLADTLRTVLAGVFTYALGGYIKLYNPFGKVRMYILPLVWAGVYGLIFLSCYNMTQENIETFLQNSVNKNFTQVLPTSFYDFSMVVIILGVSLFEFARRIRLPNSRVINYIASATFTIYLLHDNKFFYSVWNTQDWITLLYNKPFAFIGKLLLWGLGVFTFGVLMHILYLGICRLCKSIKRIAIKEEKAQSQELQ